MLPGDAEALLSSWNTSYREAHQSRLRLCGRQGAQSPPPPRTYVPALETQGQLDEWPWPLGDCPWY